MSDVIFNMAGFLESADNAIYQFTESSEKTAWDVALKKKTGNVIPDVKIDTSYLDSMVKIASSISVEAKEAAEFFGLESVERYISKNTMTTKFKAIDYKYNSSIHPNGLKRFTGDIKNLYDDISKGDKNINDAISWFNDPKTLIKYKKQIMDNDIDVYRNSKDILKGNASHDVVITHQSLTSIRSGLYQFATVYARPYVSGGEQLRDIGSLTFATGVQSVKKTISTYEAELKKYIDASFESNIPSNVCMQIAYSARLYYAELCKYLVATYLQYMSDVIHDVRVAIGLKKQLKDTLTTVAVSKVQATMESVASDPNNYSLSDVGSLCDAIDGIINDIRRSESYDGQSDETVPLDDIMDRRSYKLPYDIMVKLSKELKEASDYYKDHHHDVSDDLVIRRYELDNSDIWKVLSDPYSGNKYIINLGANHYALIVNLRLLKKFVMEMKNLIDLSIATVDEFIRISKELGTPDSVLVRLLVNIKNNLNECYVSIADKTIERMDAMYDLVFPAKNYDKVETDENDYFIDAFSVNYDQNKIRHAEKILTLNHEGQQEFIESAISPRYTFSPYYEDDNNNQNQQNNQNQNTNNNQNQQQNNNQQNNNNSADNKNDASTGIQVTDNSAETQKSDDQNKSDGNGSVSSQKLSERVKGFIDNVIDKIDSFFNKNGAKAKNTKFVNDHKDYLMKRSYANVSIDNIVPYIEMNPIGCINKIIDKASKLTADQMKTMSEDQMYDYLYGDTDYKKVKGETPDERFSIAIKIGSSAVAPTIKISNNDIKQMVPGMIDYVTGYYNKILPDLKSVTSNLDKLDVLNTYKGSGENDRTSANQSLVSRAINSAIGSCINVARQKTNDYMKVLSALVPASEKSGDNNQNNNQQNNQNNG